MKILVVCGAGYVSGLEVVTISLIQGLIQRGHDVRCIATTWDDGDFAERLTSYSVPFIRLPLGFISKKMSGPSIRMTLDQMRKLPELWIGYWRYVRDFKPDIILQSNFHHLLLLWPLLNAEKTAYHVHNAFPSTGLYHKLFRLLNRKLKVFIGVSEFVRQKLIGLELPEEKVTKVLNGVSFNPSISPKNGNGYTLLNSASPVVICTLGQIGEWKGHDDLVEALSQLKVMGLQFTCLIYGKADSDYADSLKKKINDLNLSEQVHLPGFTKNVEEVYLKSDICVVPSRFEEPFGMVAAEAALSGIPVIATRSGGLAEIVQDEITGYLIDIGCPDQLAERLKALIQQPDLRQQMGKAARKHALGQFTLDRMIQDLEITLKTRFVITDEAR